MRVLVICAALLVALTGCGGSAGSSGTPVRSGASGGPPPGGWPQPVNGQLTPKMCGLLTDADYAKYGHKRMPADSEKRVDGQPNAVDCLYMTNDELTLDLQPTAESAKLKFALALKEHKQRLAANHRPTVLAQNVVLGADESWFDYWTLGTADSKDREYEIDVRRGALFVVIVLSGLKGKREQDPRVVLSGLAGLVLQRVPAVGRTDAGTTLKVRFTVIGAGRARQVVYHDPSTGKSVTLKNVHLPWHVEKPMVAPGDVPTVFNLNAVAGTPTASIGCDVSVNGATVVRRRPQIGFAACIGTYKSK